MRIVMLMIGLLGPMLAVAQGSFLPRNMERAGTWETSLSFGEQSSEAIGGPTDTGISFDSTTNYAFGLHYNLNNHLSLGGEFQFAKPDYTANWNDGMGESGSISHEASVYTAQLRGIWNVFSGPLTPFLEANIGWTNIDSNVVDGLPATGCWYDPWWGYVCRSYYTTYDESNMSYGLAAGGRWDITPGFGVRAGYSRQWIDLGGGASDPEFNVARIELLWRF
jgi:hypothetical protein